MKTTPKQRAAIERATLGISHKSAMQLLADISELEAEVERLRAEHSWAYGALKPTIAERDALAAENARLRKALEQYADHGNWTKGAMFHTSVYWHAKGNGFDLAAAALKEKE